MATEEERRPDDTMIVPANRETGGIMVETPAEVKAKVNGRSIITQKTSNHGLKTASWSLLVSPQHLD